MANRWAKDRAGIFYAGFGLVALAAVFIGFSTTYVAPMARGSFDAPWFVHAHGALSLGWVLFFIGQALLVRKGSSRFHRKIGWAGAAIAAGIFLTGMRTALWATERDLSSVPNPYTTTIGTLTSLAIFLALVSAALAVRRRPDWHKRLMTLATVLVLWPAYFRFRHLLPFVPRPDIWLALVLADLPILVAALRDRIRYGKVHPAWAFFGSALFVEQALEVALFETAAWNDWGRALYQALN